MSLFTLHLLSQLELLSVNYLIVLMCLVSALVMAKMIAPCVVSGCTGSLRRLLDRRINIHVTGDDIFLHLLETRALKCLNAQIQFWLMRNLARLSGDNGLPIPISNEKALQNILVPENYWSGCPPNKC